jgi:hypothetical protein
MNMLLSALKIIINHGFVQDYIVKRTHVDQGYV